MASWLDHGFEVDVYSFGPVENLPKGANLRDASIVLSADLLDRLQPKLRPERATWQPVVQFSDIFRIHLQQQQRGLWLDGDVLVFRPFEVDPATPFFGWEDHHRIGASVIYMPSDSAFITDYLRVLDDPALMPHWLGWKRGRLRPMLLRLQGRPFIPGDLGITVYGNDAFSRLARKHGLLGHAFGAGRFYAWNGKETLKFYDPDTPERPETDPDIWGLHIHHKHHVAQRPAPGSLYARMLERHAKRLSGTLTWAESPN